MILWKKEELTRWHFTGLSFPSDTSRSFDGDEESFVASEIDIESIEKGSERSAIGNRSEIEERREHPEQVLSDL